MPPAWLPGGPVAGVADVDWVALAPALAPAVGALLVPTLDAALGRTRRGIRALQGAVAVGSVLVALALLVPLRSGERRTFCAPDGACGYVASRLTVSLQLVMLLGALVCLLLSLAEQSEAQPSEAGPSEPEPGRPRPELLMLVLAATAGAGALAGARDLATLLVALETASLPIVGLVALPGTGRSAEAAVKLLLTAVTSFGLLALGAALVYASTGSLHLAAPMAGALGDLGVVHGLGLALLVAGAAFKLSLVPFHLWTPDTYAGAPLPVAALLATVSKVAGLTAVVLVLAVAAPDRSASWAPLAGVLAVATMTVGNLVALRQTVAVRLLAWSTVAQAGWVVLPLAGAVGPSRVPGAVAASLGYLLAYVSGTLVVFAVVAHTAQRHPDGARHRLAAYAGLWRRHPALALALGFGLACLAGLPPGIVGLVAKVLALVPVVGVAAAGGPGAWWLVAVAVVNVVLGVAVYLRWAVPVFTAAPGDGSPGPTLPRRPWGVAGRLALSISVALCLALSVLPEGLAALLGDAPLK
jgi:NADH-quinone oxidoreductase subunit N